jgi:uncharacterized protein
VHVSKEAARRFLLGRSGIWPGRRWRGLDGAAQAMRAMGDLQLDPLRILARAQDLALHSRVLGYREDDWGRLTYDKRQFFEWGGWLAVRPMDELPYYRAAMIRDGKSPKRFRGYDTYADSLPEMRRLLQERRELSNRDFAMGDRARVNSYRGRKDSAVALYFLWRTGEAMVTRRERFERVYAPPEAVAPGKYLEPTTEDEADAFLRLKAVKVEGFSRKLYHSNLTVVRTTHAAELKAWAAEQVKAGTLAEVEVEGLAGKQLVLAGEVAALEALVRGDLPDGWKPLETTTEDEVTFLSPLDPSIADRARTSRLFDFDYTWEVYAKAENRKFGYYALPILWGDRLVGRMDAKADRATGDVVNLGTWWEAGIDPKDSKVNSAFERGLERLRGLVRSGSMSPEG